MNHQSMSAFIWSVADLLRGDYRQSDYGKVILPFTVLRRLDCVLEATKPAVLEELAKRGEVGVEPFLLRAAKQSFYNTSKLDMARLVGDPDNIAGKTYVWKVEFHRAGGTIFDIRPFRVVGRKEPALSVWNRTDMNKRAILKVLFHHTAVSNRRISMNKSLK